MFIDEMPVFKILLNVAIAINGFVLVKAINESVVYICT